MRTKALLGLAALAVGLTTVSAQVYSLNVVGYVNVPLVSGKNHLLSIPVTPVDGNFDITNTIVLDDSQFGANIFRWNGTDWDTTVPMWVPVAYGGTGWDTSMVISNGVAFMLVSVADSTLTFVGQVPQGTISYNIPAGVSGQANKIPVSTNWPGVDVGNFGDNIFEWDSTASGAGSWKNDVWMYVPVSLGGTGWDNGVVGASGDGPMLNPGQGVFYVNSDVAINFNRNFTVQ